MTATGQPMPCVAVAYSGGRDSTALLHAVAVAMRDLTAERKPGRVIALHVHHGLSDQADAWLAHAQDTCAAWVAQGLPVELLTQRVQVPAGAGLSVEAEARKVRHAALHEMAVAVGAGLLLLAHHRRDQAETLLLQALRGGGVAGLAAMPRDDVREGVRWVRPWLDHPREAIEAYIAHHGLSHIEDDSNSDRRFARNRLRLDVWPALQAAFPQAEAALAASATRLADALVPLDAWAAGALAELAVPDDTAAIDALRWASWVPALRREALRRWYARVSGQSLSASWTVRLSEEVPRMLAAGGVTGHWPEIGLGLHRGRLRWRAGMAVSMAASAVAARCAPPPEATLVIDQPGRWPVPEWGGVLTVSACEHGGVAPDRLRHITLTPRSGGERFQASLGRPARSLKKQFQSAGQPSWARQGPLVWSGDDLVFVPGLGVDARVWADHGEPQWTLNWGWLDAEPAPELKCEV